MTRFTDRKHLPILAFILLCMIWGSTWMAIKIGLHTLPPFLAAGWRFFAAFLFLAAYATWKRIPLPKTWKRHYYLLWFGLVNFTGGYSFVYWGQQYISSGMASVLFSVMPFYVLIISFFFLPQEKITLKKVLGVFIGFAGILLIFWEQINFDYGGQQALLGMTIVLIGPFFSAMGTVMGKKVGKDFHPVTLTALPMLYASLSFFILSGLFEQQRSAEFTVPAILSILYLAMAGTAVAFVLYFWLLSQKSAVLMSMITFITPPLALLFGWIFLGELITVYLVFGMALVFVGIFLTRR